MQTTATEQKIRATEIRIDWSEAGSELEGKTFATWTAATAYLMPYALEHTTGGYLKTGFTVTFADGHTYEGRIDLMPSEYDLAKHVRDFCEVYGGLFCPVHMTQEQYAGLLASYEKMEAGHAQKYADFLNRYEIGDGEPDPPQGPKGGNLIDFAARRQRKEAARQAARAADPVAAVVDEVAGAIVDKALEMLAQEMGKAEAGKEPAPETEPEDTRPVRTIEATEAAKIVRQILRGTFPGAAFTVRTDKYSGGASIRVRWMDGPTEAEVRDVIGQIEGRGFDGMTDSSYLRPPFEWKGERLQAYCFLFCDRDHSAELLRAIAPDVCERYGIEVPEIRETESGCGYIDHTDDKPVESGRGWLASELNWQAHQRSAYTRPEAPEPKGGRKAETQEPKQEPAPTEDAQERHAMQNPDGPATSRQLWALHCITKRDTRGWTLTKAQASELIDRAKGGEDISGSLPA